MKKLVLFGLVILAAQSSFAGDAGCGLGSMIFRSNAKLTQLFAMTTNHSFFSQPLGITTGTSNCSASGLVMTEKAVRYYVEVNQEDLTREMAQGAGEKLRTLASLYGCQGSAIESFGRMTQKSFGQIVTSENTEAGEMVSNLNREFAGQAQLAQKCGHSI